MSDKGTVAGFTETSVSANALKNVIRAYNLEVSDSSKIQNLLFKSVQMTEANYGELSTNIAGVIPVIAKLGVGVRDFMGNVTALTQMNIPITKSIGIMESATRKLTTTFGESYMSTYSLIDALQEM